jgi:hypothetical protein
MDDLLRYFVGDTQIDIYLTLVNNEKLLKYDTDIFQFPIVPPEIQFSSPFNNGTFQTINTGDLKMIGNRGLKGLRWSSFLPVRYYPFCRTLNPAQKVAGRLSTVAAAAMDYLFEPWKELERLEGLRDDRRPYRVIIVGCDVNMLCTIDDLQYSVKSDGDIYYDITLGEFRQPKPLGTYK